MEAPPWPWHAGGLSPLDDVDVHTLRQLTGIALQAPPEAQLRASGHFSAAYAGLKHDWFCESLQDAPDTQQPSGVARAGACSACRVVAPWASGGRAPLLTPCGCDPRSGPIWLRDTAFHPLRASTRMRA